MKTAICLLLAGLIAGCANATVTVDQACTVQDGTLPGLPIAAGISGTVSQSVTQDLSGALGKVKDVGDLSLNSESLSLDASQGATLDFVRHVKVTVAMGNGQGDMTLTDVDVPAQPGLTHIALPITADQGTLLSLLQSGPVALNVSVTGSIPQQTTPLTNTLCVGVSASVKYP
jgi:hypothetical protein